MTRFYYTTQVKAHFRKVDPQTPALPLKASIHLLPSPNLKSGAYIFEDGTLTADGVIAVQAAMVQGIAHAAAHGKTNGWINMKDNLSQVLQELHKVMLFLNSHDPEDTNSTFYFDCTVEAHFELNKERNASKVLEIKLRLDVSPNLNASAYKTDDEMPTQAGVSAVQAALIQGLGQTSAYAKKQGWMVMKDNYDMLAKELSRVLSFMDQLDVVTVSPGIFSGPEPAAAAPKRIRKSTDKEMADELEARNVDGRYDELISMARRKYFHDFKQPDEVEGEPKAMLLAYLSHFPELKDIREKVIDGVYDEGTDEEDNARLAKIFNIPRKQTFDPNKN